VQADEGALRRLVENLFTNALEHGGDHVTVGTFSHGFYVADDGPGVPEDEREQVFEPGQTSKDDGEGFGLASVRQLAVAHGWNVAVTESEAGGARFEVTDVDLV
jgi:signal transduction histidine kinase